MNVLAQAQVEKCPLCDASDVRSVSVAQPLFRHLDFGPIDLDTSLSGEFLTRTGGSNAAGPNRLVRISASGRATRLSGQGIFAGTGVSPGRIAAAPNGRVYFTQGGTVRWVDDGGTVQVIAGAQSGSDDDGVSALFADITPADLLIDPNNDLIVLDTETDRIRRIDGQGLISTIAGTVNNSGFSGDGGSATNARLNNPRAGAYDSRGNLYVHDFNNRRIRKIDTSGIITTVAGGGVSDGLPATDASLNEPVSVVVADDGTIFISDNGNHRIRRVDPGGIISTYAGTGSSGFSGDGGVATSAQLNPERECFRADGDSTSSVSSPSDRPCRTAHRRLPSRGRASAT